MTRFLGKAGVALAVGGILGAGAAAGFGIASAVSRPTASTAATASTGATAGTADLDGTVDLIGAVDAVDTGDPAGAADPAGAPPWAHRHPGWGYRGLLGHRIEHGEFTVKGRDGKPVVVDVQRGQVTAVSATSITLKSEDGFTASYTVNSDSRIRVRGERKAIGDVRVGNSAGLAATKSGDVATARLVVVR